MSPKRRKKAPVAIDDLRRAFLAARFDEAIAVCKRINWPATLGRARAESPAEMSALTMSAELFDYIGDTEAARARLKPVIPAAEERVQAFLDGGWAPSSEQERQVLKRWVWVLLQWATLEYRDMSLDKALRICRMCLAAIEGFRTIPGYACFGTLSRVHYCIGLVYRERSDHEKAKEHFLQSIELAWESLQEKSDPASGAFGQSHWTDVTIARALGLGLGFVYHMDGQPHLALPVLLSAKNLLARVGETLLSTYVDLVYFDARRSAYGSDPHVADDAIRGLERCYSVFSARGHRLYQTRAVYSLALAYTQRARPDESKPLLMAGLQDLDVAERYARILSQHKPARGDQRAFLEALLCLSRIERKRDHLEKAVSIATDAIRSGGDAHNHLHARLLIARAEAVFRQTQLHAAVEDFDVALKLAANNPRARAVCLLRLAEIHATLGNSRLAFERFEEWMQIRPQLVNVHLGRLERAARVALEAASQDFVVKMTDETLDRKRLEERLRRFLVQWARQRTESDVKAAELLDVTRQTLLNWGGPSRRTVRAR